MPSIGNAIVDQLIRFADILSLFEEHKIAVILCPPLKIDEETFKFINLVSIVNRSRTQHLITSLGATKSSRLEALTYWRKVCGESFLSVFPALLPSLIVVEREIWPESVAIVSSSHVVVPLRRK